MTVTIDYVDAIKAALVIIAMLVTQGYKTYFPESAAANLKKVIFGLVFVGGLLNLLAFAAQPEIVAVNTFDAVLQGAFAFVTGMGFGAATIGLYEFGNSINVLPSTQQILARKYGVAVQTNVNTKTEDVESLKSAGVEVVKVETPTSTTEYVSKTPKKAKKA